MNLDMEVIKMSDTVIDIPANNVVVMPNQDKQEKPQELKVNEVNYNPVFPILTCMVKVELPIDDIASAIFKKAGEIENVPNGFSSMVVDPSFVKSLPHGDKVEGAIYGLGVEYLRQVKAEFNADKCNLRTWVHILRKGAHYPRFPMPNTQIAGMFVIRTASKASPLVVHNPTMIYRSHDRMPSRMEDYTAFTAPSAMFELMENTIYLWPSWLSFDIPTMEVGGPLVAVMFTMDFLPPGV